MHGSEALGNKSDSSIFVLVEIQSTDEPARLVCGLDLDLYIALHVSPCCEFGGFIAIRLAFFGCATCGSRCTDPYWMISRRKAQKYSELPPSTRVSTWLSFGRKILRAMLIQSLQALNRLMAYLNREPAAT